MKEDHFTSTEADAAAYERSRSADEHDDERPSLSDLVEKMEEEEEDGYYWSDAAYWEPNHE